MIAKSGLQTDLTNFKLENNYPPKSDRVDQLAEGLVVSVKQVADRAAVALEKRQSLI